MPPRTIVIMATLDTKGVEVAYMREHVELCGNRALVIDTGLMGEPATRARREIQTRGGRQGL